MAMMGATIHGKRVSADSAKGDEPVDCNSLTSEDTLDRFAGNSPRFHWHPNRSHEGYNERMPDRSRGSGDDGVTDAGSGQKLTYDDFLLFPDDGKRHELIDGEHYVTASPNTKHQRVVGNLYWMIRSHLEAHPIGEVFMAPYDVVFSNFDIVEPDLIYLSRERAAQVITRLHAKGVPELVVEISSPATRKRDETIKRRLYERVGVTEYWVVDPDLDVIRIYRRSGDRYDRPIELSSEAGDTLFSPLLPGLELRLAAVFKE
jgi:Uma2 family endonuclease